MKEYQLITYCAQTSCLDCEHSFECKQFYENHGRLPYLFYKPYTKTDIEYLLESLEVPVEFLNVSRNSIKGAGRKKKK